MHLVRLPDEAVGNDEMSDTALGCAGERPQFSRGRNGAVDIGTAQRRLSAVVESFTDNMEEMRASIRSFS
jgi:hypothetical protein